MSSFPIGAVQNVEIPAQSASPNLKKTVEESIVMTLLNIADMILKNGDVVCQRMGITTQQWRIMLHLAGDPNIMFVEEHPRTQPIVASQLAEALNVSRPNITNLINSLSEKGLVAQKMDKHDKRKKFLTLTEAGLRVLEAIEPHRRRANLRLMSELSDADKTVFLKSLRHCLETLSMDFGNSKG